MPHVTYAPAGEKDLPRLREIFLRCFGEEAGGRVESAVFLRGSHPPRLPKTGSVRWAADSLLPVDVRAGGSRRTAAAG